MRQAGELVQWNDARGFGFIEGPERRRVFVHISEIGRIATRPRLGDSLSYTTRTKADGRIEAIDVKIAQANPLPNRSVLLRGNPAPPRRLGWQVFVALGLAALLLVAIAMGRAPLWLAIFYGVLGMISARLYRTDKRFAETGAWRISETTLLGVDLLGGIVGGLLAQSVFHHKTRKLSYMLTAVLLAAVHAFWLGGLATGTIDAADIAALAREACAQACG